MHCIGELMLPMPTCVRVEVRLQRAVTREAHGVHHAIRADRDDARHVLQRHRCAPEPAFGVGDHRLHDVAAEVRVLRAMRLDRVAHVGRPDHLVGAGLDLLALEEIGAVPVAGEVDARGCRAP